MDFISIYDYEQAYEPQDAHWPFFCCCCSSLVFRALQEGVLAGSVQTKLLKWLHSPLLSKVCQCCTLNRASSATTFNQKTSE